MLTRDEILNADDLKTEVVDIPEWGGQVTIREMTGTAYEAYESNTHIRVGDKYMPNLIDRRARLCAMSIIDDKGELLFSDSDIKKLSGKSGDVLCNVFEACQKINKIGLFSVENLAKNSETTQTEDSTSN